MVIDRQRVARTLWIIWAIVVWNVVFDRVLVVAGREYVHRAFVAASRPGPYARIDDSMRPAVPRAFWVATSSAGAILIVGAIAIRRAARAPRRTPPAERPSAGTSWAPTPTR